MKKLLLIFTLLASPAWGANCPSGDLYVDFVDGLDNAAGTSTGAAWKHSPGDSNATGVAACTLVPGNTVNFKGGVNYRGKITVNASGNTSDQITLQGSPAGWGTGKAIIDGADPVTFYACTGEGTGATECDNPNWASMYYATLPAGAGAFSMVFENGVIVPIAQLPDLAVGPFKYSDVTQWRAISSGITSTQVTDNVLLVSAVDNYYVGAYAMVNVTGNTNSTVAVTAYNATTKTITYDTLSANPLQLSSYDNKYHYALYNHVHLVAKAGQCAIDTAGGKIYLWPTASAETMAVSSRPTAITIGSRSYVTIDGFKIMGQVGSTYTSGMAVLTNTTGDFNGNIVQNNEIYGIDGTTNSPSGIIYLRNTAGSDRANYVRNNTISYVRGARGITVVGKNMYVQNNTLDHVGGTGIYHAGGNVGEVSGNEITNNFGVHANGISVYGGGPASGPPFSVDINVFNNKVIGNKYADNPTGGGAFTFEASDRVLLYNNVFDGVVNNWGSSGTREWIKFYNNIITEATNITSAAYYSDITFKNNILGGLTMGTAHWNTVPQTTHQYNLYTAYYYTQAAGYDWALGTGESYNTDLSLVYDNVAADNYTHAVGGLGIDNGVDLSATFTTDILGATRSAPWDIGAYESGGIDSTPAAFTFTDNAGVALSTPIYSISVQVLSIDNNCSITLTGDASCRYQINGAGDWLASGDNVALNDNVAMRATSSGSYSTAVSCTLNLGGVSDTWNVTTAAAVEVPESPRMRCGSMTGGWK